MQSTIFSMFANLIYVIPHMITVTLCIYYLTKKGKSDAVLLTIGSVMGFFLSIFQLFIVPYLFRSNIIGSSSEYMNIQLFTAPVYFIASIIFSVGLFLLIRGAVKKREDI